MRSLLLSLFFLPFLAPTASAQQACEPFQLVGFTTATCALLTCQLSLVAKVRFPRPYHTVERFIYL